jgi:hypothetical protein
METECVEIKKQAFSFSWYMRGGASYNDILNMSWQERQHIKELIESNLETAKATKMPFF